MGQRQSTGGTFHSLTAYIIKELIQNSLNISFNLFIAYFYVSLLGFLLYSRDKNLKNLILGLFFLSIILQLLHISIPNRAFELSDNRLAFLALCHHTHLLAPEE